MDIVGQSFDRYVYCFDSGPHIVLIGGGEVGLIDLDVLAPGFSQPLKVSMQQFAQVRHHPRLS